MHALGRCFAFQVTGKIERAKNLKPKKSLDLKLTRLNSHAFFKFLSLKIFHKALKLMIEHETQKH